MMIEWMKNQQSDVLVGKDLIFDEQRVVQNKMTINNDNKSIIIVVISNIDANDSSVCADTWWQNNK